MWLAVAAPSWLTAARHVTGGDGRAEIWHARSAVNTAAVADIINSGIQNWQICPAVCPDQGVSLK